MQVADSSVQHAPFELTLCDEVFSMVELRARGWTTGLVMRFLGKEHAFENHVTPPRRPRRLWRASDVYEAEIDPRFAQARCGAARYAVRAAHARAASVSAVMQIAQAAVVRVPPLPEHFVLEVQRIVERSPSLPLRDDAGRILGWQSLAVEWLLSKMATDAYVLDDYFGKPGVIAARQRLRARQLQAIAEAMPPLAAECLHLRAAMTHARAALD